MATPVGHGLVGFLVHAASLPAGEPLVRSRRAAAFVAAAVAADVDFLGRLVDGRNHHQMETHSLGCALLVGLVVWGVLALRGRSARRALTTALLVALAWASHGLVDFLSGDHNPPLGPMLFWPATREHFVAPLPLFLDTVRAWRWSMVTHNAWALARELAILLPVLAGVLWLRRPRRRS